MRFPQDAPVGDDKKAALRARLARLGVDLARVDEQPVKGTGPGGQKVNKTSSGVRLAYLLPGGLVQVKWTSERHRSLNRFLALRELADEIEERISPETSQRLRDRERVRRQKGRRQRRRRAAAGDPPDGEGKRPAKRRGAAR